MLDPLTLLDLWSGTDHADPYTWSAALLAHALIGLVLTGAVAALIDWRDRDGWIDGHGLLAVVIVVSGYALLWEGAVQHLAEGLVGALTDTVAVAAGAVIGLMAWRHRGARLALAVAVVATLWAWGIGGRG